MMANGGILFRLPTERLSVMRFWRMTCRRTPGLHSERIAADADCAPPVASAWNRPLLLRRTGTTALPHGTATHVSPAKLLWSVI